MQLRSGPLENDAMSIRSALKSSKMKLPVLASLALLAACSAASDVLIAGGTPDQPPRKVIVGTAMQAFWGEYPGLQKRLEQLETILDRMNEQSRSKYGRGLDLAILPEVAVTGEITGDIVTQSVPYEGPVRAAFSRKARELGCYIVVPLYLLEDKERRICTNSAVLVDRKGEVAGIYRKLHLAVRNGTDSMEGGMTPGREARVFNCDFGKLGIQICFDMEFDYGWEQLERQGVELVAWPTQSPQTAHPASRAMRRGCYIVSSTWRDNASIFEPTGKIASQIRSPDQVLVDQIDLSYAIVPWSPQLQNGEALQRKYGERVGFRYYADEDCGLFWSNDSNLTIAQMLRAIGAAGAEDELNRIRQLYRKAGVPE
jgi:predicted amidohydrolase